LSTADKLRTLRDLVFVAGCVILFLAIVSQP
jgi:hypothetical protein